MKKYFSILLAATAFAACTTDEFQCVLSGKVEQSCDTLFIRSDFEDSLIAAVPVKKGVYKWKTHVEKPYLAQVRYGDDRTQALRVIIEPGNITLDVPNVAEGESIVYSMPSGTALNDSISSYSLAAKAFDNQITSFFDTFSKGSEDDRKEKERIANSIYMMYRGRVLMNMKKNTDNLYGIFCLRDFQQGQPADQLALVMPEFEKNFPGNPWVKLVSERVQTEIKTCIGQPYTDLTMPTSDGKTLSLSEIISKNKFTLVDFWASWCGPCCAEIPNVKAAYQKFRKKGFEVVGISFDKDEKEWKNAIKKFGMKWPQMSDLQGWNSQAAKIYNVAGIPFTLLINQDGKIVGKDLRGEELMKKLDATFPK